MNTRSWFGRTIAVALSLALTQMAVPRVQASSHVVDASQVTTRLLDAAKSREEKIKLFQQALAEPEVQKQARAMGVKVERVQAVIPHLSDKELADLSARTTQDIAAGHYHGGGGDAGLVILGVALLIAAIVILVAVADTGDYYDDSCDCWY